MVCIQKLASDNVSIFSCVSHLSLLDELLQMHVISFIQKVGFQILYNTTFFFHWKFISSKKKLLSTPKHILPIYKHLSINQSHDF